MSKRPSIIGGLNLPGGEAPAAAPAKPAEATSEAPPPARKPRPGIVHTSVYLPRRVHKALRAIAFETDRKVHDIILEGIDAALQRYGHPSVDRLRED